MVVRESKKKLPALAPNTVLTSAATTRLRIGRAASRERRVAVFYCRYSDKAEREPSIDRQIGNNRTYAHRHGMVLLGEDGGEHLYIDRSVSGGYLFDRTDFKRMIEDARAGKFDFIVFEDVDRFSRNLGDLAKLHEELNFLGVELHSTVRGLITNIEVALLGFLFSEQRTKIISLTTQGRWQAAEKGRHPGKACFGYYTLPDAPGELMIDPATSIGVEWAFKWFDEGLGCVEIAERLDAATIPPPCGEKWSANTLRGCAGLGTGLLRNLKYKGIQAYGRVERRRHPVTGRFIVTVRDPALWRMVSVPAWQIVDPELFDRVQVRLAENTRQPRRRPLDGEPQLFRAVSFCACGAKMHGHMSGGKRWLFCSAAFRSKCDHRGKILLRPVEQEILRAIRHHLVGPEAEAIFDTTFRVEWDAAVVKIQSERNRLTLAIEQTEARLFATTDPKNTKGMTEPRVIRMRQMIEARLTEYESALKLLPMRSALASLPDGSVQQFAAQIDRLIERPPLDMQSQAERDLLDTLCEVVGRIEMRIHRSGCEVEVSGHLAGLYGSGIAAHVSPRRVAFTVRRLWFSPTPRRGPDRIEAAYDGSNEMGEDDWAAIRQLFPRRRGNALDTRRVVDAALHHARTGIPVYALPAHFGKPSALAKAIRTIRRSNSLHAAVEVLAKRGSPAVVGIDRRRVRPKLSVAMRRARAVREVRPVMVASKRRSGRGGATPTVEEGITGAPDTLCLQSTRGAFPWSGPDGQR